MADSWTPEDEEDKLAWDLRQIYAKDVVGITLRELKLAREADNFPRWFRLLKRDLRVEISHKLEEGEKKKIKELIEKVKKIIKENEATYVKSYIDPLGYERIDDALCDLEMLMYEMMQKYDMFGSTYHYDPDEI